VAFTADDEKFLREAIAFAKIAFSEREVPVGAIVVRDGHMIGRGRNRREALADPTHHAEIEAIREAAHAAGSWRLEGATLYATVEPCLMCAGACLAARVSRLVFGAPDEKAGAVVSRARMLDGGRWSHPVEVVGGVGAEEARTLLQEFFRTRRAEGYRSGRTGLDSKSSWG
jgi:tRNA(adenine34) deaminase